MFFINLRQFRFGRWLALLVSYGVVSLFYTESHALPKCAAGDTCSVAVSLAPTAYTFTAASTVTGSFTITCSCNAAVTVLMSAGGSGSYLARRMSGATEPKLAYNLLTVSGGKINCTANNAEWADTTTGTHCTLTSPSGSDSGTFTFTIPANQNVLSGTYLDAIQMTINYTAATPQTFSTGFTPTATVTSTCTINTEASNVAFGTYVINTTNDTGSGAETITCTNGSGYKTYIDDPRTMTSGGANSLGFELYSDAGRTQVYPSSLVTGLLGTGTGAPQTINYYGRIPPQSVRSGTYTAPMRFVVEY